MGLARILFNGTRQSRNFWRDHPESRSWTRTFTKDLGLNKLVNASITFNAGTSQLTAAASTFTAFAAGDMILVEGTNLNNGRFAITATDNSTFLTVDVPPKNEGPVTALVRTV